MVYDARANAWSPISVANAPSPRFGHSSVWDGNRSRVIVFGGNDGMAGLNDL